MHLRLIADVTMPDYLKIFMDMFPELRKDPIACHILNDYYVLKAMVTLPGDEESLEKVNSCTFKCLVWIICFIVFLVAKISLTTSGLTSCDQLATQKECPKRERILTSEFLFTLAWSIFLKGQVN